MNFININKLIFLRASSATLLHIPAYAHVILICLLMHSFNFSLDVNDLQNFVNISLATAAGGEDAYTRDKLSNLRTVGSGFGALIYRLPPDAGYETLVDRCKSLWDTLRSASNLPYMMVR